METTTDRTEEGRRVKGRGGLAGALEQWKDSRGSGRNAKAPYYFRCVAESLVPDAFWRARREGLLAALDAHPRREELLARVAYACRLPTGSVTELGEGGDTLRVVGEERFPARKHTYYFDSRAILRYFPKGLRYRILPGDVTKLHDAPTFVKSRPIAADGSNANSVLLRLNQVRHYIAVRDPYSWAEKDDIAVFRGTINHKPKRFRLFERWFGAPGIDLGTNSSHRTRDEWHKPPLSIPEQLRHRFVLCIEGNEVATSLKWVFASNSIAVTPRPEYETWFEEGRLEAGVHYVEVRPDYEDLPEKIAYYAAHPELCEAINRAEHEWFARFADPYVERLVGLGVARRYFQATGQMQAG